MLSICTYRLEYYYYYLLCRFNFLLFITCCNKTVTIIRISSLPINLVKSSVYSLLVYSCYQAYHVKRNDEKPLPVVPFCVAIVSYQLQF